MITLGGSPQLPASPMSSLNSCVYMGLFAKFMFEFVLTLLYCYWRNNRSFPLQVIEWHIKIQQGVKISMSLLPINLWLHIYVYFSYKQKSPAQSETPPSQWAARMVLNPSRFLFCFFPATSCLNFSQKGWRPVSQFPGQVMHIMIHL